MQTHPGEQRANTTEPQWKRRNRNVLQISIAIIPMFVLFFVFFCFLLFNINFLIFWDWAGSTHLSCFFFFFLNILALDVTCSMSSAYGVINPIICLFISSNHRYGLTRLLSFRFASVGFKLCRGTFTNKTHLIGT